MGDPGGLVVEDLRGDGDTLSVNLSLSGREREIYYRLGGVEPCQRSDALAVALLPFAMSRGWSLELPGQLSPRLRGGLRSAQELLGSWWSSWDRIQIREGVSPAEPPNADDRGVACLFTGGVDSFYSVLERLEGLDAVIFVHGFDVPLDALDKREHVSRSLRAASSELGLELIEVETNVRELTWSRFRWGFHAHGAALASVALLLGNRFREVLVPATHDVDGLYPWGTHSELDHLWSTDAVELVHHGARSRTRKIARLAESPTAMRHLRCCFRATGPGESNCGRCEKCLRTMASLRIVGALERCTTLPDDLPLAEIERMPVHGRGWVTLIEDLLGEAEAAEDSELASALREALAAGAQGDRARDARGTAKRRSPRSWRRARRRIRRARRAGRKRVGAMLGRGPAEPGAAIRPIALPDDREHVLRVLEPDGLHNIPSAEMSDLDVGHWLVAERGGSVTGVAGFKLEETPEGIVGKSLLLAVQKKHRGLGIGRALVDRRLELMIEAGATKVVTNTDRPELIAWLSRDYGFREVGVVAKLHEFGRADVDHWTTLEAPIELAAAGRARPRRSSTRI